MASQQSSVPTVSAPPAAAATVPRAGEAKALKVSASSRPTLVAGAIAGMVRERGRAEVQAIGAAAINQAVKAVAIARGYMAPSGVDLVCVPGFIDVVVDTEERTAIRLAAGTCVISTPGSARMGQCSLARAQSRVS